MAALKLYYDLLSQPSRAVFLFLKANKLPFTSKPIALRKGEQFSAEYTKLNPFQIVPAIDDNGFFLTESVAILKYLSDKCQVADHWYPKDLQRRARVDCYMAWQHLNLRQFGVMTFRTKFLDPGANNAPVDTVKLAYAQAQLETTLDVIERTFLKDQSYLSGADISLSDLLGICELMQPLVIGHDVFRGRPKLEAWAGRVKEKLDPHFDEAHVFMYKIRDKFAPKASPL